MHIHSSIEQTFIEPYLVPDTTVRKTGNVLTLLAQGIAMRQELRLETISKSYQVETAVNHINAALNRIFT